MTYPLLSEGDQLPAVGVLQKLLRRTGKKVAADGIYGPLTREAVREFQKERHLGADGIVGPITWPRLLAGEGGMGVQDCVDVFDPPSSPEDIDVRAAGGNPIVLGGMCNGVEQAVQQILSRVPPRSLFLLRFHGHGSPGWAGFASGTGGLSAPQHHDALETANMARVSSVIARLKPLFGPYGCIQFMHCSTGRGTAGTQLLQTITNQTGVPVSAALNTQLGGGSTTFRFEGPTKTVLPGGKSLRAWAEGLPEFFGKTVA